MRNTKVRISLISDNLKVIKREISFVNEGCVYFFNAQHIFLKLTTIERCYFDFLAEQMDYENRIDLGVLTRKRFISFYNIITSTKDAPLPYRLRLFEKKFKELKLLIELQGKGHLHYVNPKYVFKGKLPERKKILQHLTELGIQGNLNLLALLDRPLSEIMQTDNK